MRLKLLLIITISAFVIPGIYGQKDNKRLTITGLVTDSNNKPVTGAMIYIDDINTNKVTNNKGIYKVKTSANSKLMSVFTMSNGMAESIIDGRTTINFTLSLTLAEQNENQINAIVNEQADKSAGTENRNNKSSSFNKLEGNLNKNLQYSNIYEMLSGTVPGVQVNGKNIVIRGQSSLYNTSGPLLVVNGLPVTSIDHIRPIDVKSIEVLKSSSAAIYGSRGSNGVILIQVYTAADIK
jgi:TonB-dependent SusC/RagA subfamily outer membrane receptor